MTFLEDVVRWYYRSKRNLWYKYRHIVDEWTLYYNGLEGYIIVMKGESDRVEVLNEGLYNSFMENVNNEK